MADDEKRPEARAESDLDDKDLEDVNGGLLFEPPKGNIVGFSTDNLWTGPESVNER